jgi:flagellar assembly factor FliW
VSAALAQSPASRPEPATVASGPPEAEITFPQGLPGFPGALGFRLEPLQGRFLRLGCTTAGGPTFIVLQPAEASTLVTDDDVAGACAASGLDPAAVVALFVVTVANAPGGARLTVNRRAPMLVDLQRRIAFQLVLPRPDYAVRYPLVAPTAA